MRSLLKNNSGFAKAIGGLVALLVAIIIAVLVFYSVNGSISFTGGGTVASRSTWNTTNSTATTVWSLLPIVAIVMIASIILAVVSGFGSTKGGV
jgi:ABC-type phosphate transport system permease subunit